jgi:hypothetical protein
MVVIPLELVQQQLVEIPSTILVKVPDDSEKLVKSMEEISLQGEEIKNLKEKVKTLQEMKSMFQYSYHA